MLIQHTVLFKFPAITAEGLFELKAITAEFNSLEGIVAVLKAQGTGLGGQSSFLESVAWEDQTEGYTHSLVILAKDADCLKHFLHSSVHLAK